MKCPEPVYIDLLRHGETANAPSLARGPRLDPIGETANAPSLARGPRLDPIGETEGGARYRGVTDDRLTAAGWQQMWAAVGEVARWTQVVTSPLARCAEFARALAQRYSLELRVDARLRELDFGVWEGLTADDIARRWPDAYARFLEDPWIHGPPGGESAARLQVRVLAAWRELMAQPRPTLLISHGGPLRMILCHVLGLPRRELLRLPVPYGGLHRLTVDARGESPRRAQSE